MASSVDSIDSVKSKGKDPLRSATGAKGENDLVTRHLFGEQLLWQLENFVRSVHELIYSKRSASSGEVLRRCSLMLMLIVANIFDVVLRCPMNWRTGRLESR